MKTIVTRFLFLATYLVSILHSLFFNFLICSVCSQDGLSPLHMAVVLGNLQMVRELITHGALPNTASEVTASLFVFVF
jgi:ankyrin repeat protein